VATKRSAEPDLVPKKKRTTKLYLSSNGPGNELCSGDYVLGQSLEEPFGATSRRGNAYYFQQNSTRPQPTATTTEATTETEHTQQNGAQPATAVAVFTPFVWRRSNKNSNSIAILLDPAHLLVACDASG